MRIEFLLEEESARIALDNILPQILPDHVKPELRPYQGKQDLLRRIKPLLRAYSRFFKGYLVILIDQDRDDCRELKERILKEVRETRMENQVVVRIIVPALESWFLGDPDAIERAFPRVKAVSWRNDAKYRKPDTIQDPVSAISSLIVPRSDLHQYKKLTCAELISEHMDISKNRSTSFSVFASKIQQLASSPGT